jgi:hypothetical protein
VLASYIEGEILCCLSLDFSDRDFLSRTIAEAHRMAAGIEDDPGEIEEAVRRAEKRLANMLNLGADGSSPAIAAKIRELESEVNTLREHKAAWAERRALKEQLNALKEADLKDALIARRLSACAATTWR